MSAITQSWVVTDQGLANGAIIILDRWSSPNVMIFVEDNDDGNAVMTLEGTAQKINQGETPVWSPIYGTTTGQPDAPQIYENVLGDAAPGIAIPTVAPMEALRISISAGTGASGTVTQADHS